jgi:phosphoserine phosphatase RsbU/P
LGKGGEYTRLGLGFLRRNLTLIAKHDLQGECLPSKSPPMGTYELPSAPTAASTPVNERLPRLRSGGTATRALYVFLFAYIVISLTYQFAGSVSLIVGYFDLRHQVEAPFDVGFNRLELKDLSEAAKQAGLKAGDRVESLDGVPYRGRAVWQSTRWYAHPGDVLRVGVRRPDGTRAILSVPLLGESGKVNIGDAIFLIFLHIVVPLFCLLIGYWVVLARPKELNAWLILVLLTFPQAVIAVSTYNWLPGIWLALRLGWHLIPEILAPGALLWLGLLFPERSRIDLHLPWVRWLIAAVLMCCAGVEFATDFAAWYDLPLIASRTTLDAAATRVINWMFLLCIVLYWVAIFEKLRTASTADARRRLRVLCLGSLLGLGGALVIFGALPWFGISDPSHIRWLAYLGAMFVLIFPLSLAYVVVVQRAMDLRLVIRQGLQYTLARRGVFALQILLSAALFIVVALLMTSHAMTPVGTVAVLAVGIWGIFLLYGATRRVAVWIDRRFFRDAYNAELILSELAEKVRTMVEARPLLDTVTESISGALHVPRMAVLLDGSGPYRPAHAMGYASLPAVEFPEAAATVQVLKKQRQPVRVYFDDPQAWIYRLPGMTGDERAKLAELRSELLLPLLVKDHLTGFMSLGQKLSEAPYSGTDLRLLNSVAAQTSLALEVSRLSTAVAREAAQRERLNREVEIAREVQEHLFPQQRPSVPGLDYYGLCRPAREVGGDYYDFLELPDGKLGVAIGDVSGKGIGAALLMASLEASVRGHASARHGLAELMRRVNSLIYDASAANHYATFFYCQYHPHTHELTYVNAGHNPPFVLHKMGVNTTISRLDAGGPVVGLLRDAVYEQGTVVLDIDDMVVLFTDGVSESMNARDEEWSEDRLIESAKACDGLDAAASLSQIMKAAVGFAAGAPQHDDMTLVVLRVVG